MGNKWQEEEERIRAAAIAAAEGKARELGMTEVHGIVCEWLGMASCRMWRPAGQCTCRSIDQFINPITNQPTTG
jgi:hypothetical protein